MAAVPFVDISHTPIFLNAPAMWACFVFGRLLTQDRVLSSGISDA